MGIVTRMLTLIALIGAITGALADKTHTQNKKANKLYENGKYQEALRLYDEALLEVPDNLKLRMNKGSALYKLERFDKADEAYGSALGIKDKKALADLHYDRGNALFMQGEQMLGSGNPGAAEKYKSALESYITALDYRSDDRDAKWNLQLTQQRIEQLQNMPKQQNKNDQNRKEDQQQQNSGENRNSNQEEQQNEEQERADPKPQPQEQEEQLRKEEAERLIQQFADDADDLNKPKKVRSIKGRKPEKDW